MIIRHNLTSINLNNKLDITKLGQSKSLEKLSGGFRINRAADDAAGLSISEKMRAQINGLDQAQRNVQDGISLIQVAEGGLNEVHSCLQRTRELLTQAANGTYIQEDRESIQSELDSLVKEIDHIADYTNFNGKKLLNGSSDSQSVSQSEKQKFMNWLNGSWLNDAAQKIETTTGWTLKNDTTLSVSFENIDGAAVATMSGWYLGSNLKLTVNTDYMSTGTEYQGTDGPTLGGIPSDRLITHEMVHGYMFNNVSSTAKPASWFVEGLAEAVHGASDIRYSLYESGVSSDYKEVYEDIYNFDFLNSDGNDKNYTVGYLATSYLYKAVEGKSAGSFKTMLTEMNQTDETFEALVVKYTGASDYASFISTMKNDAKTAYDAGTFNATFLIGKCNIDLTDGKADPLDGNDLLSSAVIPNLGSEIAPAASTTTLKVGTNEITVNWNSTPSAQEGAITLQIGDTADQSLSFSIQSVKAADLSIDKISALTQEEAVQSLEACDAAINTVSTIRASLGAYQNRLEHSISNLANSMLNTQNAESRIKDVDMAKEMMTFMKHNILSQAELYLSTQVNQTPSRILELLQ